MCSQRETRIQTKLMTVLLNYSSTTEYQTRNEVYTSEESIEARRTHRRWPTCYVSVGWLVGWLACVRLLCWYILGCICARVLIPLLTIFATDNYHWGYVCVTETMIALPPVAHSRCGYLVSCHFILYSISFVHTFA